MLSSWIMQIVLSGLLGVPTTMETSMPDDEASFNFYDRSMRFSYSKGSHWCHQQTKTCVKRFIWLIVVVC